MKDIEKICICGGGSLGLVCAGFFLSKGIEVNLLTDHPSDWEQEISVIDLEGRKYGGLLNKISSSPQAVISDSDLVLLTVPGFLIKKKLLEIKPFLNHQSIIGSIVSSTGFFFEAHEVLGKEFTLFGFQRVPFIARTREYGKIGDLLGYKPCIYVAIENCDTPEKLRIQIERLFSTKVNRLNSYFEASLTNSNPILHTGRLYILWKDYTEKGYKTCPKFYADWDDKSSECIIKMDEEFQKLLKKLGIKAGSIPTLLNYYESTDAKSLTKKIQSIPAFKSIPAPMKKIQDEWHPDFQSRYFTEDFPFGLHFIYKLCKVNNISSPTINKIYEWGIKKLER
ncbi:MAG: NAD/NADP octopine/nopaline dehydrogenase family protein [Muribaculaceae bacterium]|nr:NAD/NADP octopine/nopaline dehydrogenase family protein [Muribaculaceae bacterium]